MMRFINPKIDFAFKKIFGSEQSKEILISFLNALIYEDKGRIQDLEIINPYLAPRIRGMKDSYVDVRAKLFDGTMVIIEMQVLNVEGFEKRILYNAAKAYSIQLGPRDDYTLANPVIALTLTDFTMFETIDKVISRFILKEKDYLVDYPIYDIELIFVELPKFNKSVEELGSIAEKWIYFIKHARGLEGIPTNLGEVEEVKKAFELALEINLSREELDDLEHSEIWIMDQRNAIKKALRVGREKGMEEGKKEGREEGRKEGREEGRKETKKEIARSMLQEGIEEGIISKVTGLSIEEINRLKTGHE
jgi:predicted transposase/invertase (TIGR01784 family)